MAYCCRRIPEVRKRFVTFVNAKAEQQNDPHIQFASVRGQIRPKNEKLNAIRHAFQWLKLKRITNLKLLLFDLHPYSVSR